MRVLVCGGRNFADKDKLWRTLDEFSQDRCLTTEPDEYGNWLPAGLTLIHGAAKGADTLADGWAVANFVPIEEYPADWQQYGRSAGYKRNFQMLHEGQPDVVIAFPGGAGTKMMKTIARNAGVEVIEIE